MASGADHHRNAIQIKTTMRQHLTTLRISRIKRTRIKNAGKEILIQGNPCTLVGGNVN